MTTPARKAGRTKARRLRAAHGIGPDAPMPCLLSFAEESVGVSVLIFEHLGSDLAGVYLRRGEDHLVVLNGSDHPVRLRFTLAHELAHHCFNDAAQPDTRAGLARPGHWIEVRANAFASELLVPEAGVAAWVRRRGVEEADLYDVVALALEFGVSAMVAHYRLIDAGIPTDAPRVRREIDEGRHRPIAEQGDPFADGLLDAVERLPRIPERFRGSVFVRLALGEMRLAEGARRLGVAEPALREAFAPLGLLPPP